MCDVPPTPFFEGTCSTRNEMKYFALSQIPTGICFSLTVSSIILEVSLTHINGYYAALCIAQGSAFIFKN